MKPGMLGAAVALVSVFVQGASAQPETARAVETVAMLDLGIREAPTPTDYTLTAQLLSLALEADPDRTELARSLSQAAWSAGDTELMIRATREIVRRDPQDTVAQLRLISSIINRGQTVAERLEAYTRFTEGEDAARIDPAVRSRLLLDAALLEREGGNSAGYERKLRASARLDPSNKEAQSLLAQSIVARDPSVSTQMRLQLRMLYADPLDPHIHIAIAKLCAGEGATDAAWRFLNNGALIFGIDAGQVPPQLREQRLSLLWQYEGTQAILDALNPALEDERLVLEARIEARLALNEPTDDLGTPEDIRYPQGIDRIRVLAAYALGDQESVDSVLRDLQLGVQDAFDSMRERLEMRGADKIALLQEYLGEVVTLQTMRAIVWTDPEVIDRAIDEIVEGAPQLMPYFRPLEPFTLYVKGQYEEARTTAEKQLGKSASRDLLIALSSDKLGEKETAIEQFIAITHDYPLAAEGAMARARLAELTDGADLITDEGRIMAELASEVPDWIEKMIRRPEHTMRLSMKPAQAGFNAVDQARVVVELENLIPIPLALGPSHPIDSGLLIVPGFKDKSGEFLGTPRPRVIDMGRRLRLEPLETLRMEVDPDSIQTRWLLRSQPSMIYRQRWRALQGFKLKRGGGIINSPFALVSETPLIERMLLPETAMNADQLIERLGSDDPDRARGAVLAIAAAFNDPQSRPDLTGDGAPSLVDAMWSCYERADASFRAWMLAVLPTRSVAPAMSAFDMRVVESVTGAALSDTHTDPVLLAMVLMTRVDGASSPALEAASLHPDDRIQLIGEILRERLRDFSEMYATVDRPFVVFTPEPDTGLSELP